eukprot:TRINITY_DN774160_c0_g1_i1.p1 TRINITY_DN774160_c0_g1~~TRINITY_DN774160_c0_g1_i1.p1  ORF type:complete len:396 (-),score=115.82 TRINITY_DN774160_c0_g1_i1:270-1457(-)
MEETEIFDDYQSQTEFFSLAPLTEQLAVLRKVCERTEELKSLLQKTSDQKQALHGELNQLKEEIHQTNEKWKEDKQRLSKQKDSARGEIIKLIGEKKTLARHIVSLREKNSEVDEEVELFQFALKGVETAELIDHDASDETSNIERSLNQAVLTAISLRGLLVNGQLSRDAIEKRYKTARKFVEQFRRVIIGEDGHNSKDFDVVFEEGFLGMELLDQDSPEKPQGVYVKSFVRDTRTNEKGLAEKSETIERGDIITAINGTSTEGLGLRLVLEKIRKSSRPVNIRFTRFDCMNRQITEEKLNRLLHLFNLEASPRIRQKCDDILLQAQTKASEAKYEDSSPELKLSNKMMQLLKDNAQIQWQINQLRFEMAQQRMGALQEELMDLYSQFDDEDGY